MDTRIITTSSRQALITEFERVRRYTEVLCQPLAFDDYQIQSIDQSSPPKWHIAHVSWLFEVFVLPRFQPDYRPFHPGYDFLFNSYYYTHGQMHPRPSRGLLSRSTVEEVYRYRAHVNRAMRELMETVNDERWRELAFYVILGLNHEEQHQELMLMDIKHNFFINPLKPAYREELEIPQGDSRPMKWLERSGGIHSIGHTGEGFAYDNETPRHEVLLRDYRLADRFITNAEYLQFMEGGG